MNHDQINPPEPHPRDLVTCEQCGEDLHRDDMVNVGGPALPVWICGTSCMKDYAEDVTAEFRSFKRRSSMLVKQVTHGASPHGYHDWGRWDVFPSDHLPEDCLVFKSLPDTGRFRLIEVGGDE